MTDRITVFVSRDGTRHRTYQEARMFEAKLDIEKFFIERNVVGNDAETHPDALLRHWSELDALVAAHEAARTLDDPDLLSWHDTRELRFGDDVDFGKGFDFEPWELLREEALTHFGLFAVFPGMCPDDWWVYGGSNLPSGKVLCKGYTSADDAKRAVTRIHLGQDQKR